MLCRGVRARGARSAAAAIKVATFTLVPFGGAAAASSEASEGTGCDVLEPPRPARRALATLPVQPHRFRDVAEILSAGPDMCEDGRECRLAAGAALLVPQGRRLALLPHVLLHRCAATAARVDCSALAAERVRLARAAGPFVPLGSSQPLVLGSIGTYSSRCARRYAARAHRMPQ